MHAISKVLSPMLGGILLIGGCQLVAGVLTDAELNNQVGSTAQGGGGTTSGMAGAAGATSGSTSGMGGAAGATGGSSTNGTGGGGGGCFDGMQNGMETDIDCGGPICPTCTNGDTCVANSDCISGNCKAGTCSPKDPIGTACTDASSCASGFCADGFCCVSACSGTCQTCAQAEGSPQNGTCSNVATGTDPNDSCTDDGPSTCGTDGMCNSAGQCRNYAAGTPCGDAQSCTNGVETKQDTCNGFGTCTNNGTVNCDMQSQVCIAGACAVPPSCAGLATTCGPSSNENCCASPIVLGGPYNRSNDPLYPAMVSDFRLDRFEITVGRFRQFVYAGQGTQMNPPTAGAGAHPLIPLSGWDSGWYGSLVANTLTLTSIMGVKCDASYQTWTDTAAANENLPMNCITWYEAFAFCAWDGGRLATEAEWNYAAAGGNEQREYPWSNPPSSMTIGSGYAVYDCTGDGSPAQSCAFTDILKVGSRSATGDGKWMQADLAGSMWEWNLDWHGTYPLPCNNCANLTVSSNRVVWGGCWYDDASFLLSSYRASFTPSVRARPCWTGREGYDLQQQANATANVSNVALAVGGAALVAGVVVFVTAPSGPPKAASGLQVRVGPVMGMKTAGLLLQGEW